MTNVEIPSGSVSGRPVLALLLICATLTVMAGATIAPSLPGLLKHFEDTPNASTLVPLILTIPGLAIALSAPLCGMLVDRIDPRIVLLVGIVLYIVAGSSGLYLDGLTPIILGRVLLGLAVGGIMTSSTTLIANLYSGQERGRILGYQASAMGFGGVIFILAGGFLADVSWRGPFAVYLAPFILLPLVFQVLPNVPRARSAGPVAQVDAPFPIRLAVMVYASMFFAFLIFYNVPTQIPFLLQHLGATQAKTTGFVMAGVILSSAILSLSFGRIRAVTAPDTMAAVSFIAISITFFLISIAESVLHIFLIAPFLGAAFGVLMPNFTTWLLSNVPQPMMGRANGMLTMSVFLAQFLSAFVGAWLVSLGGLRMVFWPMAVFAAVLGAAYVLMVIKRRVASA